jgi:protein-disulfide isomerase-like protein with CxxC motif
VPAITATVFNDPGCPWGYSFRPAQARLQWRFGDQIDWRLVLIGLTESGDAYVRRGYTPAKMAGGWRKFERRFGMPFAFPIKDRVAGTSPACRAIVAAREIDPVFADPALRALQLMHFTTSGLLDDEASLRTALAGVDGLDADAVIRAIDSESTWAAYEADRALTRTADGTPTHVQNRHSTSDGPVRYTAPSVVFTHEDGRTIEVGGFQPFEAYDTALANLDPALERYPAPSDAAEVLEAFPDGVTSAEVAAVLRSELGEPDLAGTQAQLIDLVGEGAATCEPFGSDALWRPARVPAAAQLAAA